MGNFERAITEAKNFWSKTSRHDTNTKLILAQVLISRRFPVWIHEFPTLVVINATSDGKSALNKVSETPECLALLTADNPGFNEPAVDDCYWNDETKKRVLGFYWQNKAALYHMEAEKFDHRHSRNLQQRSKKAQAKAKELLGDLPPLTSTDIRSLLEPVVDRVLAQTQQSS